VDDGGPGSRPRPRPLLPWRRGPWRRGPWRRLVPWWHRRGLRARVTLTAAAGLLVAFAAADLLLFSVVRVALARSVDDAARQAAGQIVALINSQPLPQPVPVTAGTVVIQVLAPDGRIIDGSAAADRLDPLLPLSRAAVSARTGQAVTVEGAPYDLPPTRLSVVAAAAANGDLVIAAVPYGSADASLSVVGRALAFGTPLLFALFTWAIWLAVGSTLRPIALLRRGAASISATGVPAELPVPLARDEVRSLAVTLNDMLGRLALAQQRQRDLVSDTAHELRSPIASIRAQLEVALDHPSGQDWAQTARDVHADVLRLARLAEDLLTLARLDERALAPRAAAAGTGAGTGIGAGADLARVSAAVVGRYGSARVPVVLADAGGGPCPVAGDRSGLDRVLVNLIDNAVRYAATRVTVSVRRGDGWCELAVTDDGPGIRPEDAERAFGRFTRLDCARSRDDREAGGAGLGLAIVRATAQAYGGTARLEPACEQPAGGQPAGGPLAAPGLRAVVRLPSAGGRG
jgi:signal transduction histidine kinase